LIYYVSTERFSATIRYFLRDYRAETRSLLRSLTYEELFFERAAPIGHYLFTDFDRLSRYELECASALANALRKAAPEARLLNHPLTALERYPLLVALHKAGLNDFSAIRIECGDRPTRYPVFIRAEEGYGGPETDLLHDDAEFDAAMDDLRRRGLPMRGRLAVGFAGERSPDGYFHKYGAFNIGGHIVPHDRLVGQNWSVKFFQRPGDISSHDEAYSESPSGVVRELEYIKQNPHREELRRAFAIAGIDFGRADYSIVKGRVQVYEINTNPDLPNKKRPSNRTEKRAHFRARVLAALKAIDVPMNARGRVRFEELRPRAHNLHWPRKRLPISLARRLANIWRAKLDAPKEKGLP
jgi:hypothetical protein